MKKEHVLGGMAARMDQAKPLEGHEVTIGENKFLNRQLYKVWTSNGETWEIQVVC